MVVASSEGCQTQELPDPNVGHIKVRIVVHDPIARTQEMLLRIEVALWSLAASNGQDTAVCLNYDHSIAA